MKKLRNFMEEYVEQYLDDNIGNTGICECEDCRMDIMAIMLNKLPPSYVATHEGSLFAQLKQANYQYSADLARVMAEAVEIVRKHPRHDPPSQEKHEQKEETAAANAETLTPPAQSAETPAAVEATSNAETPAAAEATANAETPAPPTQSTETPATAEATANAEAPA